MLARGLRGQSFVERQHLTVVVPERPQRVRQERPEPVGADLPADRVPVHAGLAAEPRPPGRQVGQHRDQPERPRRREQIPHRGAHPRPRHPGPAAQRHVPEHGEQRERGHVVTAAPLHAAAQAEQHPGGQSPPAHTPPRPVRVVADPVLGDHQRHPGAHVVAVAEQREERGDHEQGGEHVEHAHPRLHVGQAVAGQQQPGQAAERRGPGEPPGRAHDQQHGQHPGQRRRDPPADTVVAERHLAERDQLLAQRGVHDLLVGGVVLDPAVAHHLPGLRHVVLLVEDGGAAVGRLAEVPQPQDGGEQRDGDRDRPAAQRVGGRRAAQPRDRTGVGPAHRRWRPGRGQAGYLPGARHAAAGGGGRGVGSHDARS